MPDLATPADQLAAAVHDVLSALVPGGGGAVLAFSPIPTPLDPRDYLRPGTAEVEPVRAGVQLSLVADAVGELVDGELVTGTVTASGLFGLLLSGTSNGTPQEAQVYGSLRGAAEQRYTGDLHLIEPSPRSWCVPDAMGWSTFGWSASESHTSQDEGAAPPGQARWDWQVLAPQYQQIIEQPAMLALATMAELAQTTVLTEAPVAGTVASAVTEPAAGRAVLGLTALRVDSQPAFALSRSTAVTAALATDEQPAEPVRARFGGLQTRMTLDVATERQADVVLTQIVPMSEAHLYDPRRALQVSADLQAEAVPHTADSTSMEVSFAYALVKLTRPWWDGLLVRSPGWTIPGYPPGSLSPGPEDASRHPLGLPVGMLLVRDVKIAGRWSGEQTSVVENSMSFGPFSLLGRKVSTDAETSRITVRVEGMQLFAWLVEPLPQLPPGTAPTPPVQTGQGTTPANNVLRAGSSGADVRLLQQRLHDCGYATAVDGVFGPATTAAVRAFQTAAHLKVDGVVGSKTWAALEAPSS